MPMFLIRLLRSVARTRSWVPAAAVIGFVFATSWPLMILAEPAGAPITQPANYWWWFLVTASTVGYGDFYPVSTAGHLLGVYVIIGGIATLTTLFAQLAGAIDRAKGRRMRGLNTLDASGHIVVLGYTPGRTERIVDELLADSGLRVVICAREEVDTHPMPDRAALFVRGDLTAVEVLRRAGVHRAHSVLIDVGDDNEALAVLVTVDHLAPTVHTVVGLRDMARADHLRYVNGGVRCVQWHSPRMITEELQTPGISRVYADLMTHGGGNTYALRLPATSAPATFGDWQTTMGQHFDATVLAADTGGELLVSPPWQTTLPAGAVLYYVSQRPLAADQVARALQVGSATKSRPRSAPRA